jgi:hypothetical protein
MAKALDKPPGRMTVDQFVGWAAAIFACRRSATI